MYVHVYEQDNRKKNVECLPVTAEETGEPPWRVRPALGSAVGRCVSWGITECQGGKPTFSRGLLKTQPLSLGRVSTVDYSPAATAAANSLLNLQGYLSGDILQSGVSFFLSSPVSLYDPLGLLGIRTGGQASCPATQRPEQTSARKGPEWSSEGWGLG